MGAVDPDETGGEIGDGGLVGGISDVDDLPVDVVPATE